MSAISTPRPQTTPGGASATFAWRRPRRRENLTRPRVAPRLITLALLLVLALLTSIPGLRSVTNHIRHINPIWLAVAIALELAPDLTLVAGSTLAVAALPRITRTRPGTPRCIRAISAGVQTRT